jgi:hypothetical protein
MTGRMKVDCCLQDGMRMQGLHPRTQRRLLTWHAVAWTHETQRITKIVYVLRLVRILAWAAWLEKVGFISNIVIPWAGTDSDFGYLL